MKARMLSLCAVLGIMFTVLPMAGPSEAQSKKLVHFEINAPYRIRMAQYLLPPDRYYLQQVSENDLNLFFLFKGSLRHTPIAAVRTTRIYHASNKYPNNTEIRWVMDEESGDGSVPLVTGWEIPGEDGWEIIAITPRGHSGVLRARY